MMSHVHELTLSLVSALWRFLLGLVNPWWALVAMGAALSVSVVQNIVSPGSGFLNVLGSSGPYLVTLAVGGGVSAATYWGIRPELKKMNEDAGTRHVELVEKIGDVEVTIEEVRGEIKEVRAHQDDLKSRVHRLETKQDATDPNFRPGDYGFGKLRK